MLLNSPIHIYVILGISPWWKIFPKAYMEPYMPTDH